MLLIIKLSLRDFMRFPLPRQFILLLYDQFINPIFIIKLTLNVWSSWRFWFFPQTSISPRKCHLPSSPSLYWRLMGSPQITLRSSWWTSPHPSTLTILITQTKTIIVWKNPNLNEKCQRVSKIKGKKPIRVDIKSKTVEEDPNRHRSQQWWLTSEESQEK